MEQAKLIEYLGLNGDIICRSSFQCALESSVTASAINLSDNYGAVATNTVAKKRYVC